MSRRNFSVRAESRMCARPQEIPRVRYKARRYWVHLNVMRHSIPLGSRAQPALIGFSLPERLAGAIQDLVGFPRRSRLQRCQEDTRRDSRQEQRVHVIPHNSKRAELVMTRFGSLVQGIHHDFSDRLLRQIGRTGASRVQVGVDPGESFTSRRLGGTTETPGGHTAVQRPGDEQPSAFWVMVGQAAARVHRPGSVVYLQKFSCAHEWGPGTHECVRYECA